MINRQIQNSFKLAKRKKGVRKSASINEKARSKPQKYESGAKSNNWYRFRGLVTANMTVRV